MKVDECVDYEFVDDETEGRSAERAAECLGYFAEGGVLCRIVGDGDGGSCSVACDESEVRYGTAAVGAGDDCASAGVDEALEEMVSLTHDVVPRIFMKDRGEE